MKAYFYKEPSGHLNNFVKLAQFQGIDVQCFDSAKRRAFDSVIKVTANSEIWVIDLLSLQEDSALPWWQFRDHLSNTASAALALTPTNRRQTDKILDLLTGGNVTKSFGCANEGVISFTSSRHSRQLRGAQFHTSSPKKGALAIKGSDCCDPIMMAGNIPSFICTQLGNCRLFIWATENILDIDQPVNRNDEHYGLVDQFVPALIFLKAACGERCWRNGHAVAGITIDDPLLKRKYGYIDFKQLIQSAEKNDYHVTLGFIPWNWWRTNIRSSELFLANSKVIGICIHGCDHINNEYGIKEYETLRSKTELALERLRKHRERTAIDYQPVMIFPQGRFSKEAIAALGDSKEVLCAVNSTVIPTNLISGEISFRDTLMPALEPFCGFPIFVRHAPLELSKFALDFFLGKPAIAVVHHDYFEADYTCLEDFCRACRNIEAEVSFGPIGELLSKVFLIRTIAPDEDEVRFFTSRFSFWHSQEDNKKYRLMKRVGGDGLAVDKVLVNGKVVPFRKDNSDIIIDIDANKSSCYGMEVEYKKSVSSPSHSFGFRHNVGVAMRRFLSEFRDDWICRNETALRISQAVVKAMKKTGDT